MYYFDPLYFNNKSLILDCHPKLDKIVLQCGPGESGPTQKYAFINFFSVFQSLFLYDFKLFWGGLGNLCLLFWVFLLLFCIFLLLICIFLVASKYLEKFCLQSYKKVNSIFRNSCRGRESNPGPLAC